GAAAQEHVLAVVEGHAFALERVRGATQPAPDLHQRHRSPGVGAVERRGDPREPTTYDEHAPGGSHVGVPSMLRAATHAFSCAPSETRSRRTSSGWRAIRCKSLW